MLVTCDHNIIDACLVVIALFVLFPNIQSPPLTSHTVAWCIFSNHVITIIFRCVPCDILYSSRWSSLVTEISEYNEFVGEHDNHLYQSTPLSVLFDMRQWYWINLFYQCFNILILFCLHDFAPLCLCQVQYVSSLIMSSFESILNPHRPFPTVYGNHWIAENIHFLCIGSGEPKSRDKVFEDASWSAITIGCWQVQC